MRWQRMSLFIEAVHQCIGSHIPQIVGPLLYTSEEAPEYRRGLIAKYVQPDEAASKAIEPFLVQPRLLDRVGCDGSVSRLCRIYLDYEY